MDSMEIEQRFPNFEVISEFTGSIYTMVAVKDGVRYWDYIGKHYGEFLLKERRGRNAS